MPKLGGRAKKISGATSSPQIWFGGYAPACGTPHRRLCDVDIRPAKATTCVMSEKNEVRHCSTCSLMPYDVSSLRRRIVWLTVSNAEMKSNRMSTDFSRMSVGSGSSEHVFDGELRSFRISSAVYSRNNVSCVRRKWRQIRGVSGSSNTADFVDEVPWELLSCQWRSGLRWVLVLFQDTRQWSPQFLRTWQCKLTSKYFPSVGTRHASLASDRPMRHDLHRSLTVDNVARTTGTFDGPGDIHRQTMDSSAESVERKWTQEHGRQQFAAEYCHRRRRARQLLYDVAGLHWHTVLTTPVHGSTSLDWSSPRAVWSDSPIEWQTGWVGTDRRRGNGQRRLWVDRRCSWMVGRLNVWNNYWEIKMFACVMMRSKMLPSLWVGCATAWCRSSDDSSSARRTACRSAKLFTVIQKCQAHNVP